MNSDPKDLLCPGGPQESIKASFNCVLRMIQRLLDSSFLCDIGLFLTASSNIDRASSEM